jgi:hypothetical protein
MRFMREVDSLDDRTAWQLHDMLKGAFEFGAFCVLAMIVVILATLIESIDPNWLPFIFFVTLFPGVIATIILYIAVVRKKTTNRWFARWKERIARRKYQRHWRYQALRFVQKTQYPLEDVRDTITTVVQQNPGVFKASSWLPGFMARDFGLAFYALAHLYER